MVDQQLIAQQLSYRIKQKTLINQVDLTLNCGELVAIIGPNGAGKSTLLRLLTGYLPATQGQCQLAGKPLKDWPCQQLARQRAVMQQYNALTLPFTVEEIIAMGRMPYQQAGINNAEQQRQAIDEAMQTTGLTALRHASYQQLSGGEKQRVQLARCLTQIWHPVPIPCWLFLDEPTSALDLYQQQTILRQLKQLTQQRPLSVCCVLHDLNLAALYADKLYLLHQGNLVASGQASQVLTEPMLKKWYQAETIIGHHPQHPHLPHVYLQH